MTIDLPQIHSGKVRELYDAGGQHLLMVASDRVSAFDVIMAEPIRHKGRVLTAMTAFWCGEMSDVVPVTLLATDPEEIEAVLGRALPPEWAGRAVLVQRAEMLQIECIVRGYLAGQAHEEYVRSGTVHGTADAPRPQVGRPPGRAHLHAVDQGRRGARHQYRLRAGGRPGRARKRRRRPGTSASSSTPAPRPGRPTSGSSWPTPSSSWGTSTACSACATRCARRTRRGCGPPTRWSPAGRRRRSTSSPCGTGWRRSPGIARRPRRPSRPA